MDATICGASAFAVWRTPPLMRLIADPLWWGDDAGIPIERLVQARRELKEERGLWRLGIGRELPGTAVSHDAADGVLLNLRTLLPSLEAPVDVAVWSKDGRRASRLLRPHVVDLALAEDELVPLGLQLLITSPALTLLQLAPRLSLPRLVMAASEFCGSFSVYRAPEALRALVEELAAGPGVPVVDGWRPSFDREGRLTDVWSRPPLALPEELAALAARAAGRWGRYALAQAAELVVPGAAPPFVVPRVWLGGWGPAHGGEGHGGFVHNERLALDARAQRLAGQGVCYCDLFWPEGEGRRALDVECHSATFHLGERRELSDADRALALQSMGVEVLFVTYAQVASPSRFEALAQTVAEKLGREVVPRDEGFLARRAELRREVLVDFHDLLG